MKHWIAKQLIGISEITGWTVPSWVRRLIDPETCDRLVREEQALTQALRSGQKDSRELPPFLKSRLDRAIAETENTDDRIYAGQGQFRPAWALAAAAALVAAVSLFVLTNSGERPPNSPQVASQPSSVSVETPVASVGSGSTSPEPRHDSLENDLILKPLAQEQARLAADMTNAMRFVAESFLPNAYAQRIDDRLTSLEKNFSESI